MLRVIGGCITIPLLQLHKVLEPHVSPDYPDPYYMFFRANIMLDELILGSWFACYDITRY